MNEAALDERCINTLRVLSADMVEKAQSGHPGLPMGAAAVGYVLWTKVMRHNPGNPEWPNRDRFVLSAGHGSALLYSLLHLCGYGLPLEELKQFRQWGGLTPGHPEYGHTAGVETTTGPLGQGFANAVGMAMAEHHLAAEFNRPEFPVVDYFTYVLCSDGDLMEGLASEAASIAGHLRLGKLIAVHDDNRISIEGPTDLAFSEQVGKRFEAYGWRVWQVDGNDPEALLRALGQARQETDRPSLIQARTHIGYGSPGKQDTAAAHGEPLGAEELRRVKQHFGFSPDEFFSVQDMIRQKFLEVRTRGRDAELTWRDLWRDFAAAHAELAAEWDRRLAGKMPQGWRRHLPAFIPGEALATRQASGAVLNALVPAIPELAGGSADLAPSTGTQLKGQCDFGPDHFGCPNFHFGVREHAMAGILNGLALCRQIRPYGATFLIFSDYLRPALRLSALMRLPVIYLFTHDSIALGEDGPTHQPVEQLASLRAIPGLTVLRPADARETAAAWAVALERGAPAVLVLSRQKLPVLETEASRPAEGTARGAYIVREGEGKIRGILIATGAEVHLALAAQAALKKIQVSVRVVSMPSWELFGEQPAGYQAEVLPPELKLRLAIEAASPFGWARWTTDRGDVLGVERFGASAPGQVVMEKYGFTVENVVARFMNLVKPVL